MSAINDGGPAFPRDHRNAGHNGMSLRDWFAGQALAGMCASAPGKFPQQTNSSVFALGAYEFADAMLSARAASTGNTEGKP